MADETDILLTTASPKDYREICRDWANHLVKMGLTSHYGVFAEKLPVAGWGIYLGKQSRDESLCLCAGLRLNSC